MQEITVRRAKPRDAEAIAAFVNQAWRGQRQIDRMAVIERFGNVGFMLAEQDSELVGLLGWQAKNLVVGMTDMLVGSAAEREAISQALLAEMERVAEELQCEAALLFLPRPAPLGLVEFFQSIGYEPQLVSEIPRAWQEAARQEGRFEEHETVMVKKLRERRVLRPM